MAKSIFNIAFAAVLAALSSQARADDRHDAQVWGAVFATVPLGGKVLGWAEGQARFGEDVGRLSQTIVRPGLGYQLSSKVQLWAGYGRITTHRPGDDLGEDRAWQQLSWAPGRALGGVVSSRTRLEQRFVEGGRDTGWRLREMLRYERPLGRQGGTSFVATSEWFFALNGTDWGARSGFDQSRNFVGFGVPVAPKARLEVGYLNQYINRRGPADAMNHAAALNLFLRY